MMWVRLVVAAAASLLGLCLIAHIPPFYRAYVDHQQRLDDDAWLRTQCADPDFFSKLRRHTDVCDDARTAFMRPAWLVGFQACLPSMPVLGWHEVALVGFAMMLVPSLLLPLLRAREERWERQRMLDACNPHLLSPTKPSRYALLA